MTSRGYSLGVLFGFGRTWGLEGTWTIMDFPIDPAVPSKGVSGVWFGWSNFSGSVWIHHVFHPEKYAYPDWYCNHFWGTRHDVFLFVLRKDDVFVFFLLGMISLAPSPSQGVQLGLICSLGLICKQKLFVIGKGRVCNLPPFDYSTNLICFSYLVKAYPPIFINHVI